jgi:hypothetical protein
MEEEARVPGTVGSRPGTGMEGLARVVRDVQGGQRDEREMQEWLQYHRCVCCLQPVEISAVPDQVVKGRTMLVKLNAVD